LLEDKASPHPNGHNRLSSVIFAGKKFRLKGAGLHLLTVIHDSGIIKDMNSDNHVINE
jgi:hypothetical protein